MPATSASSPRPPLFLTAARTGVALAAIFAGIAPGDVAATTAPAVALNVRVQGLALGEQLVLRHETARLTATLNEPYRFEPQVPAGSPLDLRISRQPDSQTCRVSEGAPPVVPADGRPIFVRCVTRPAAHLVMADTLPNDPLVVRFAPQDRAYPGLPYESRPGLAGGIFPYEFRLAGLTRDGAPVDTRDVELDFRTGAIRFTPAEAGNYELTLDMRDSGRTPKRLRQTFAIRVKKANHLFVAPNGVDAAGRGSLQAPFQTIAYAQSQSGPHQVLMLRQGRYGATGIVLGDERAKQIVAYPDEVVTLDLARSSSLDIRSDQLPMPRVEGVDITGVLQYGINVDPARAGAVIRHVRFLDGLEGPTQSENPGFIHTWGDLEPRHKLLVQDNDFGRYVGAAYATTFFDAFDSIIENNQVRLGADVNGGFHDKDNSQFNVYRRNYIEAPPESPHHGVQVSAQGGSKGVHIHHNLLLHANILLGTQCVQDTCSMRNHDVHHNTLAESHMEQAWGVFNPGSRGSRVSFNIISSGAQAPYWGLSCQRVPDSFATAMTTSANLIETTSAWAHNDIECSGNDMGWSVWQDVYGRDTFASGSTVEATSALVGAGPLTGLPAGDARRGQRGHQWR
ncbi:hypothetical protein AACH06_23795 [Ideonella sp. DXS29W]|uniref:Right handed beta helix domain-containing protein n=1 Tax=Ideonella lacteola TaxID=2984193 RepID=A0ABU9BVT5_9BURK